LFIVDFNIYFVFFILFFVNELPLTQVEKSVMFKGNKIEKEKVNQKFILMGQISVDD